MLFSEFGNRDGFSVYTNNLSTVPLLALVAWPEGQPSALAGT